MSSGIRSSMQSVASPTPGDATLTASFTFQPTGAGGTLQFAAGASSTDSAIQTYDWKFGDGANGTGQIVTHTYAAVADYTVELTVRDASGNSKTVTRVATPPAPGDTGTITLDFRSVPGDSAGTALAVVNAKTTSGGISSYEWSTPGSSVVSTGNPVYALSAFTNQDPAVADVTLRVRDTSGGTRTVTRTIEVGAAPGSAATDTDAHIVLQGGALVQGATGAVAYGVPDGGSFTFYTRIDKGGASVAGTIQISGGHDTNTGVSFSLSKQNVTMTDGAAAQAITVSSIKYAANVRADSSAGLSQPGPVIALFITGTTAGKKTMSNPLLITSAVQSGSVTADFSSSANSMGTATFQGSGSASSGTVSSYSWAFGDGGTATGQNVSHVYAASGSYNATLTVTSSGGVSKSITKTVVVPVHTVTADFTSTDGSAGLKNFSGSGTTTFGGISSYGWNFGDGSTGSGQTTSHQYAASGTYNVTLTVTDSNGKTAATTKAITVSGVRTNVSTSSRRVVWQQGGVNGDGDPYPEYDAPNGTDATKVGVVRIAEGLRAQRVQVTIPAGSIPASGSAAKLFATFTGGSGAVAWLGANSATPDGATYVSTDTDITALARSYGTVYVGRFGNSAETVDPFTLTIYRVD